MIRNDLSLVFLQVERNRGSDVIRNADIVFGGPILSNLVRCGTHPNGETAALTRGNRNVTHPPVGGALSRKTFDSLIDDPNDRSRFGSMQIGKFAHRNQSRQRVAHPWFKTYRDGFSRVRELSCLDTQRRFLVEAIFKMR